MSCYVSFYASKKEYEDETFSSEEFHKDTLSLCYWNQRTELGNIISEPFRFDTLEEVKVEQLKEILVNISAAIGVMENNIDKLYKLRGGIKTPEVLDDILERLNNLDEDLEYHRNAQYWIRQLIEMMEDYDNKSKYHFYCIVG